MVEIAENNQERLHATFKKYHVQSADIFGSATTSYFRDDSDIDLLVSFRNDLALLDYADNYFDLKSELEELFKRKVDLVSARSLKNPILIENINLSKVPLYAA